MIGSPKCVDGFVYSSHLLDVGPTNIYVYIIVMESELTTNSKLYK
jgi:hypothetical protein